MEVMEDREWCVLEDAKGKASRARCFGAAALEKGCVESVKCYGEGGNMCKCMALALSGFVGEVIKVCCSIFTMARFEGGCKGGELMTPGAMEETLAECVTKGVSFVEMSGCDPLMAAEVVGKMGESCIVSFMRNGFDLVVCGYGCGKTGL